MKSKLLITGLALMALTTLSNAQDTLPGQGQQSGTGKYSSYVDANKDGICDNFENKAPGAANVQRNGNSKAGAQGQGQCLRQGCGQGCTMGQKGMGHSQSRGRNFVDSDKNGVCDLHEKAVKK